MLRRRDIYLKGTRQIDPVTSEERGLLSLNKKMQQIGNSNCLIKTQVFANT